MLGRIGKSEDDVSKALEKLFAKAVQATDDEMKRARARQETGRAPGKADQSLGDQINWEQFLSHCKGRRQVWVISKDGDYVGEYGGRAFLNASLYNDLGKIEVFAFTKLEEGIRHFVQTTGAKADKLLTLEEAKVINQEQAGLPPLDRLRRAPDNPLVAAILGYPPQPYLIPMGDPPIAIPFGSPPQPIPFGSPPQPIPPEPSSEPAGVVHKSRVGVRINPKPPDEPKNAGQE